MYLLYLDESGCISEAGQRYFVLAGLSVFERSTHWIEQELNQIAQRFSSHDAQLHDVELHAAPMRNGKGLWRAHRVPDRLQAIKDSLSVIRHHHPRDVRLFGVALCKQNYSGRDIAQEALTQVCSRFDLFLMRLFQSKGDKQRGLIIFDKSSQRLGFKPWHDTSNTLDIYTALHVTTPRCQSSWIRELRDSFNWLT